MISTSRRDSVGGGGGSSRIFPLSSVAKSHFYPTSSDIRGYRHTFLVRYAKNKHFLLQNFKSLKLPKFREML